MNYNQQLAIQIDNICADIYTSYTRFAMEYELREQQARDFKAANYEGVVPRQVAAFANRANVPAQASADLIISQADQLYLILDELADIRMRKYEVLQAADDESATTAYTSIISAIETIRQTLP